MTVLLSPVVSFQRRLTDGRVAVAGDIAGECTSTVGCVFASRAVAEERTVTGGHVAVPGRVIFKRGCPTGRVLCAARIE